MANVSADLDAITATRTTEAQLPDLVVPRTTNSGVTASGGTTAHPITS